MLLPYPLSPIGMWNLEVGQLDFGGTYTKSAQAPQSEDLYINYMWIESDVNNYTLSYVLIGNENSPDKLNTKIHIFDAFNGYLSLPKTFLKRLILSMSLMT